MSAQRRPARRGPRTGEDTRSAILDAARSEFAQSGYDGASLRGIARAAGVDPALVHHYFDGKEDLFAQAVVLLSIPGAPRHLLEQVLAGPRETLGERAVEVFLTVWDEQGDTFVALMRSVSGSQDVARGVREFLGREIFGRIASEVEPGLGEEEGALRGGLVAAQMMGLAMARYVVRLPGIADAPREVIIPRVGRSVQGYLLPEG